MTRKLTLTFLVALYLAVTLVGLVCLAAMGPILAVVALAGMAGNGFMAADWVGQIWQLEGQYDDGEIV
jgi:ABC-type transporter Mla maintaining outer membrane lipid asymmetry permease subunit MlaE